jgi:hypothetical protein
MTGVMACDRWEKERKKEDYNLEEDEGFHNSLINNFL